MPASSLHYIEVMCVITKEDVLDALKDCNDPEISLSIVDLGFVESVSIEGEMVHVGMILTSPACPFQASLAQSAHSRLLEMDGITEAHVEILNSPRWTPARLSPHAKSILGLDK